MTASIKKYERMAGIQNITQKSGLYILHKEMVFDSTNQSAAIQKQYQRKEKDASSFGYCCDKTTEKTFECQCT
jgi:hypothetical protein